MIRQIYAHRWRAPLIHFYGIDFATARLLSAEVALAGSEDLEKLTDATSSADPFSPHDFVDFAATDPAPSLSEEMTHWRNRLSSSFSFLGVLRAVGVGSPAPSFAGSLPWKRTGRKSYLRRLPIHLSYLFCGVEAQHVLEPLFCDVSNLYWGLREA